MDALTHAIEAYTHPGNTPFTRMFATRAIQQISVHLRQAVNGPNRPEALKHMLYAADIAGQSMSSGLGQVHGLSHVVSGRLGTPHGVANAILLSPGDRVPQRLPRRHIARDRAADGHQRRRQPAPKGRDGCCRGGALAAEGDRRHVEAERGGDEGSGHPAVRGGRAEVAGHLHRLRRARYGAEDLSEAIYKSAALAALASLRSLTPLGRVFARPALRPFLVWAPIQAELEFEGSRGVGFGIDLDEVRRVIDAAEVLVVRFAVTDRRLLIDTRTNDQFGPLIKVVPCPANAEERFRSLKVMRPRFRVPERILTFEWPRACAFPSGGRFLGSRGAPAGGALAGPSTAAQCDEAYQELLEEERKVEVAAIRGSEGFQTLWPAGATADE